MAYQDSEGYYRFDKSDIKRLIKMRRHIRWLQRRRLWKRQICKLFKKIINIIKCR